MVAFPFSIGHAQKRTSEEVPKIFLTARYAYVQALDGDIFDLHLVAEDRKAIQDVEDALRDWKRYVITTRRDQAELVFVVRKGRSASAQGRGGGARARGGLGAEVGPGDDLLYVYMQTSEHELQGPIWKQYLKDGLDTPGIPLFKQLKDTIEAAQEPQKTS